MGINQSSSPVLLCRQQSPAVFGLRLRCREEIEKRHHRGDPPLCHHHVDILLCRGRPGTVALPEQHARPSVSCTAAAPLEPGTLLCMSFGKRMWTIQDLCLTQNGSQTYSAPEQNDHLLKAENSASAARSTYAPRLQLMAGHATTQDETWTAECLQLFQSIDNMSCPLKSAGVFGVFESFRGLC